MKHESTNEPVAKLQVTLEDRPIDIELAQYKRMFEAACFALGSIGEALDVDENEGGAEPILAAITELNAQDQKKDEALRLALEALNRTGNIKGPAHDREQIAITLIEQALENK